MSLADEKNSLSCLNWAPQSSGSTKARECKEKEMNYEAEIAIPIVGNAIRSFNDIKSLLANTLVGSGSIVVVKLDEENGTNPVIILAADKLYCLL